MLICRKILSADSEGTKQNLTRDETVKEVGNQSPVHEVCNADNRCSSSVNVSSQKPVDSNTCVENVESGLMPNLESSLSHTKDNVPDAMETSPSVSPADVDNRCENRPKTDTKDENHCTAQCSVEQSGTEDRAGQKYSNVDVDAVASASVCDSDKHRTEASSEAELEQTDSLTRSDCTSSDIGRDSLQSGQSDLSLNGGSDDKISTDSGPSLSSALMNEVISD